MSAVRDKLDGLELSGRERDVANAIYRLVRDVGVTSARLTHVQIFRASGRRGKDLGDVMARLERMRILVYEKGPEGTRYWLNPRTEDWGGVPLMTQRDWDNLVAEVRAVEIAAQRTLDLVTEQPSLASLVVEIAGSAEDCTERGSVAVGRRDQTLLAGADSRIPLPSPQSSARSPSDGLRERVKGFVGDHNYRKFWGHEWVEIRIGSDHFRLGKLFESPRAEVLDVALSFSKSAVDEGVKVKKDKGAMLWWHFAWGWFKRLNPDATAEDFEADRALRRMAKRSGPGGCQAAPENRADAR